MKAVVASHVGLSVNSTTQYSLIRGGSDLPIILRTMKKKIFNEFLRQVSDLQKYMNAYSFTLRDFMGEEDFSKLYDSLCEIDSKYETYPID